METTNASKVRKGVPGAGRSFACAAGLGLLAAGSYYFNFFLSLGDGSGVYLSAGYRRVDLLTSTAVLWIAATSLCWLVLALIHAMRATWARRLALAGVAALAVSGFIRCYSKLSGVGVTNQVLTITGGSPDSPLTKAALLAPFVIAFAVFFVYPRAAARALRFTAIAGMLTLPVGALRMVQTPVGRTDALAVLQPAPLSPTARPISPRRVVWVLFDEFDPQVAFEGALGTPPLLPHFATLMSRAVVFTQAASPAKSTDVSVPALLLGRPTAGNLYRGPGDAVLLSPDGTRIPLTSQASLFGAVERQGGSALILGFYHPYCEVFVATRCRSFGTDMGTRWFDGLVNFVPDKIIDLQDPMGEITRAQAALLPQLLSDRRSSLVYLHLNVPHLPAEFAARHFGVKTGNWIENYKTNLRLADELLATVVNDMAPPAEHGASKPLQMLIVSSDHWYRGRPGNGAHPALQIVKVEGDDAPQRVEKPVSAYHLAHLVQDFLAGRVSTQREVVQWYVEKPFVPTWVPHDQ